MPAARGCQPGAERTQTRALCLEAREPLRRQHGHGLDAPPQRQHAPLLQRRRGHGYTRRDLAALPLPRVGEDHPVRPRDARVREVHDPHRGRGDGRTAMRAVALIDGEHSPDVVREALRDLPYEWVGAILIGGTEKLREGTGLGVSLYGVPLLDGFAGAESVVDLSDEPVMRPDDRFHWASRALAAGLAYH